MPNNTDTLVDVFDDIATAINNKGVTGSMTPSQMATKIGQISTGITPTGTYPITSNGTYDVTSYASAEVNVSGTVDHTVEDALITRTLTTYSNPRVTSTGQNALSCGQTSQLTTVDLPSVVTIGPSTFNSAPLLTSVNIPAATSIGIMAFYYCASLTQLDLPSVEDIAGNAFAQSASFALLNLYSPTRSRVPSLAATSALQYTAIANGNGYIVINDDLVDSLKRTTNWSTYANQIVSHTWAVQNGLISA